MGVLRCLRGHEVCGWDSLYFYEEIPGSNAWHLILKPELMDAVPESASLIVEPSGKTGRNAVYAPNKLLCLQCKKKVGMETTAGPNRGHIYCFDSKGVILRTGFSYSGKGWKSARPSFQSIESLSAERCFQKTYYHQSPLVTPKPADFQNLDILSLTCSIPRNYQIELFVRAAMENSIIVLPTGTGKTLVAVMVVKFLRQLNEGKICIFLADRIPLVNQQANVLKQEGNLKVKVLTGYNSHSVSDVGVLDEICLEFDVLALTAQVFVNLLRKGFMVAQCSLLVFDEAHHARGHHPYTEIMESVSDCRFESRPHILGLTASPGGELNLDSTVRKIKELSDIYCSARFQMPDLWGGELQATTSEAETSYHTVDSTEAERKLQSTLWNYLSFLWRRLRSQLPPETHLPEISVKRTSTCRKGLQDISQEKDCLFTVTLERMLDILLLIDESTVYGVSSIVEQLLRKSWTEGERMLLEELPYVSHAERNRSGSSKVMALLKIVRSAVSKSTSCRILVFVETRYTARALESILARIDDVAKLRPSRLVGHSGFDGMTWEDEQRPMLDRFRSGIVQLLIATSVLEEGIDVPSCNVVIRFDGIGSMTGTVQSRGRARLSGSKFAVLTTEEEWEKVREMRRRELNMLEVIRSKTSSLSLSEKGIVDSFVDQVESERSRPHNIRLEDTVAESNEDAGELSSQQSFVLKLKFQPRGLTEKILKATLRGYVKVLKCDLRDSIVYLCTNDGHDTWSSYRAICSRGIPQLLQQSGGGHLWLQRCSMEPFRAVAARNSASNFQLKGITVGSFRDPSTFVQVHSVVENHQDPAPSICWATEYFLQLHVPEEAIFLEFSLAAIYGWVLLHHDVDNINRRLYIPLRQAPEAYSNSTGVLRRVGADLKSKSSILNLMGDCLVIEVYFNIEGKENEDHFHQFLQAFETHGILVYGSQVVDICSTAGSISFRECGSTTRPSRRLHFTTAYLLECIFSCHVCTFPRARVPEEFFETLYDQEQDTQERILKALLTSVDWFCSPLTLLQRVMQSIVPAIGTLSLLPPDYIFARHAVVTPSRVIYFEPLPLKRSRLLRHFDPDNFLKVSFRDENMGFIPGNASMLMSRVQAILTNGLQVAEQLFNFLGSSSSMLRSHSCWMTTLDPSEVRNWLGDFSEIRCVGKYMARVGLGMAPSDETITVEDKIITGPIPDIPDSPPGLNSIYFSDGVGRISSVGLERVLQYFPQQSGKRITALQVRVAGYKGVLALDPSLSSEEMCCQLRKSMRKFPSPHRKLEVLSFSASHPVYLNRQAIVLLSCLGVPDSAFEKLQEQQLLELLGLFAEDQSEKAILRNCQGLRLQPLLKSGINIPAEPFLQHILSTVYFQKVQNLVKKSHIYVPGGRLLMGVLDETNSLNYGEIFVQISDESTSWELQVIEGPCATYRNPCFHPGDVRVLEARNIDKLHHLVNCVVFPAKGARPHPNEMSGSDLDGDLYTIIWMSELVPLMSKIHEPMSFDQWPPLEIPEVTEADMFKFFIKTMESAELGLIANSHMALADIKDDGALDDDCKELAELHAEAVDFPKTGRQVKVRKDLIPNKFPDFMEKHKRPSYPSQKIIGRLYRRAKCLFGEDLKRDVNVRVRPDDLLIFEGHDIFSEKSREAYKNYCTLLRGLMQCYGVKQEAEIVTGCIVSMHDHLTSELFQWTQVVKQQFRELVQKFRDEFFGYVTSHLETYRLASSWYLAAYTDDEEERRCVSFPWMVADVLAVIKKINLSEGVKFAKGRATSGQSLQESVYYSMRSDFIEKQPTKFASLWERQDLLERVEMCVQARFRNASVKMFGSSSTFLFESSVSDVDLCIVENEGQSAFRRSSGRRLSKAVQIETLDKILPCLQQDFPGTYAIKDTPVPILKNDSGTLAFDLTADDGGLRKSQMVLNYIVKYPELLLAMTVVVRWARSVGLIASQSRGQFTAFSIAWLLIQFCLQEGFMLSIGSQGDQSSSISASELISAVEEVLDPDPNFRRGFVRGEYPGEILLRFFQKYANLPVTSLSGALSDEYPFQVPDPLGESKTPLVKLNPQACTILRNRCLQAWHVLTRTRDVRSLYALGERHVCMRLTRFQSGLIRGEEDFYAQQFSSLGGGKATVRFVNNRNSDMQFPSRNQVLHIDIKGDPVAVQLIEKELQELNSGQCWTARGGANAGAFYVKGASILLFEGSLSEQDRVGFSKYPGPCHLKHVRSNLHVPGLVAKVGGSTWEAHALSRLRTAVWRQRQFLLFSEIQYLITSNPVDALIRFGTLYVTNVPFDLQRQSLGSVSVAELEEYLARGKKKVSLERAQTQWRERTTSDSTDLSSTATTTSDDYPDDLADDDLPDLDDDCVNEDRHPAVSSTARRKKPVGGSQSLFPHTRGSLDELLEMLQHEEFMRVEPLPEQYQVTLFTPKELKVRLNHELKFMYLSLRRVRWLSGNLLFRADDLKQLASPMQQQQRPNCMRFYIRSPAVHIEQGDLVDSLRREPVLEFTSDGEIVRIGSAFKEKVGFVRRVKKHIWVNKTAGLSIKILDVMEWEGWNKQANNFKVKRSRQEVELHILNADEHLRGSEASCRMFIQNFWESALKYKDAIL